MAMAKNPATARINPHRRAAVTFVRVVCHTSVKTGAYGTNAGHHTGIPVTVFQVESCPAFECVCKWRQAGLLPVRIGIELNTALVGYQQDNQSVILSFLANAPFVEQPVREVKTVLTADGRDNRHYGFNAGFAVPGIERPVYFVACRSGKDTGRVTKRSVSCPEDVL